MARVRVWTTTARSAICPVPYVSRVAPKAEQGVRRAARFLDHGFSPGSFFSPTRASHARASATARRVDSPRIGVAS
jgi:hypothetical protein